MKGSEQEKEDFVKLALQTEILEKSFPQTKRKQYTDPKTTVQPAEGDLLAFLNRNNYLNEFGQPYQKGDNVYMIETLDLRNKPQESTGGDGTKEQVMFGNILADLKKGKTDLFTAITATPGGETFYKKFEDGIYEVDKEGEKKGNKPVSEKVLMSVYQTGTK